MSHSKRYKKYKSTYDKYPCVKHKCSSENTNVWKNNDYVQELKRALSDSHKKILVLDCYPGVDTQTLLSKFNDFIVINCESICYDEQFVTNLIYNNLTEDRVFGVMGHFTMSHFYDDTKIPLIKEQLCDAIKNNNKVLLYGVGAMYVASLCLNEQDILLVYADMPRWEIQLRMRKGMSNWLANNSNEDMLKKYKRAYFVEWRTADSHKKDIFHKAHYFLDSTDSHDVKLVEGKCMREALAQVVCRPFRVKPFFDPGVWGGQWMKEVCDLDVDKDNYAWCFDGVPEENSLLLQFNATVVEVPSINLVFFHPQDLLGEIVHSRFGTEFPIRFDFLDTMDGQNLSLQVHPLTEYIQEKFGMHYTQDESYYMLDAEEDACVYLGLKENINSQKMLEDLYIAQEGKQSFDATKYVNKFPAKKHDHFLIPAGTVHCSGKNSMVLEISATPYIFTFKLWDWDRLGLDGLPRPVHLDHGKKVIEWDRDTTWVKNNLINNISIVDEGDGWKEEKTGLHEREFIETRRHTFTKPVKHNTNGTVHMLNLVEGSQVVLSSPTNAFEEYTIHYAETFIVPANLGEYVISPVDGEQCITMKAWVRGSERT